jgi:cytochrome c-type biogenesis protein CcmH
MRLICITLRHNSPKTAHDFLSQVEIRAMYRIILLFSLLISSAVATAIDKTTAVFSDPTQEMRYKALSAELRCVVCQNQSLADSNAELAQDLRDQVRTLIIQGQSDAQIIEFLVSRYGDFVLYRPPFKASTAVLWIAPGLLLLFGIGILIYFIRRQQTAPAQQDLSSTERDKLKHLLDE